VESTAVTKQLDLPKSATILISKGKAEPCGEVEVTPNGGRIYFVNQEDQPYRIRFYRPNTDPLAGFDVLLPAPGFLTIVIKENDEFMYEILSVQDARSGGGGGPIKN